MDMVGKLRSTKNTELRYSNCLIEAIRLQLMIPYGDLGWDRHSPSGNISFYFDFDGDRYRFRRKVRRHGNKSRILFWGYQSIENIP